MDNAQLQREETTAVLQQSNAVSLNIVPSGLPAEAD